MKDWRRRRREDAHVEGPAMSLAADEDLEEQRPRKRSLCQTLRRDAHAKCLVLTLLLTACLAAVAWCRLAQVSRLVVNFQSFPIATRRRVSPCDEGYIYIPVAFLAMLYVVYLVECWHCSTRLSLAYKVEASAVYEHVRRLREAQPVIWWKAVCYHYVRRSRRVTRYRNGDAYTTTQTFYERVNSHATGSCFVYSSCGVRDISRRLTGLERFAAVKLRFSKGFAFADPRAADEFEGQRARFFTSHERLDDYLEMREGLELVGAEFQEYMVAFADKPPWYVSQKAFWVLSLLLLSWPLRFLIECQTAYVHYQVTKLFGGATGDVCRSPTVTVATRGLAASVAGDRLSRGSTADSVELEQHISDNFTLAPSYSEALLLLPQPTGNGVVAAPLWRSGRADSNGNITNFPFDSVPPTAVGDIENEEDEERFPRVTRERRSSLWRWAASGFSWGRSSSGNSSAWHYNWSSSANTQSGHTHRSHHYHHHSGYHFGRRPSSPILNERPNSRGGLPVSLSRVSLANGHVVYLVSPLRSGRTHVPRGMRRTFTCPQNAGSASEDASLQSPAGHSVFGSLAGTASPSAQPRPHIGRCHSEGRDESAPLPTYEEALLLSAPLVPLPLSPPAQTAQTGSSHSGLSVSRAPSRLSLPPSGWNSSRFSPGAESIGFREMFMRRSQTDRDFNSDRGSRNFPSASASCVEFREAKDDSSYR